MKYISLTHIDALTQELCTAAPMSSGPRVPTLKGWREIWVNASTWPIEEVDGIYQTPVLFFGTCDDDADTSVAGVIAIHSEQEFASLKYAEYMARKPFPSWIGDESTMTWQAPTPLPIDENTALGNYYWDEPSLSWKSSGTPVNFAP